MIFTSAGLPDLRDFIAEHEQLDYLYSDEFLAACRWARLELDQAIRTDRDNNGRLQMALDNWVLVGKREVRLHKETATPSIN